MKSTNRRFPITGTFSIAAKSLLVYLIASIVLSMAIPHAEAQPNTGGFGPPQDPYQNSTFSSTMAIIIVVLISALLFMGLFSIYIRHCTTGPHNVANVRSIVAGQATARSRRVNRGLDLAVIETFPTFPYSTVKGLKIGKGALECAVCLNEFQDDESLRLLPKCDHVFHPECIDAWLSSHVTCPVCRANLAVDPVPAGDGNILSTTDLNELDESNESTRSSANESTRSNANDSQNSVSIRVNDDQNGGDDRVPQLLRPVSIESSRSMNPYCQPRSGSMRSFFFAKFPRSHSTGHSVVHSGENVERFTLRLPNDVRKQIMNRALDRRPSLLTLPRETSSRRGYRLGGEVTSARSYKRLESLDRVSKSDRWVLTTAPPFVTRVPSIESPKTFMQNYDEATSSATPRGFINSLKKSFSRLNSKGTESVLASNDSARQPV